MRQWQILSKIIYVQSRNGLSDGQKNRLNHFRYPYKCFARVIILRIHNKCWLVSSFASDFFSFLMSPSSSLSHFVLIFCDILSLSLSLAPLTYLSLSPSLFRSIFIAIHFFLLFLYPKYPHNSHFFFKYHYRSHLEDWIHFFCHWSCLNKKKAQALLKENSLLCYEGVCKT